VTESGRSAHRNVLPEAGTPPAVLPLQVPGSSGVFDTLVSLALPVFVAVAIAVLVYRYLVSKGSEP
jgi:hypothetical protein